jgi:Flp pilus assembly protein TadG
MLALGPLVRAAVVESVPEHRPSPMDRANHRMPGLRRRDYARGQSLVEFSLVLIPLLLILLGIIQMGFVFNTQVTITNAAREGGRAATIYSYSLAGSQSGPPACHTTTRATNDACRNAYALYFAQAAFGTLSRTSPQFVTTGTWTRSGFDPTTTCTSGTTCTTTYRNGDIVVIYTVPVNVTDSDPRTGEQVTVQITYHQDLFIPLISALLPHDANGRLAQGATVTMVIN